MLNLKNIPTAQVVRIPLMYLPTGNSYMLRLINGDGQLAAELSVGSVSTTHGYLTGSITLPSHEGATVSDLPDGEYTYALRCGTDTISAGLLTLGDYKHTANQYKETIQFKPYAN